MALLDLNCRRAIRFAGPRIAKHRWLTACAMARDEACQRYQLSADEFLAWQRAVDGHGIGALRVTRLQFYRVASASDGRALRARRGL
jgi:Protein of unknown function (DUF1153)